MGRASLAGAWLLLLPQVAWAQPRDAAVDLLAAPLDMALTLSLVALLPLALFTLTSFVKISTVLHIVRSGIGAQSIPSNAVILALSGSLTILAMAPVGSRVLERATPTLADRAQPSALQVVSILQAAREPVSAFLRANADAKQRRQFYEIARDSRPAAERDRVGTDDLVVLIPSFLVTELLEAFALGFAILLPFIVIDLVVANVLVALGMTMLPATQVSLPFKLLLFVAVDGWSLLARALVTGYVPG
jgi:type III secretion protein R